MTSQSSHHDQQKSNQSLFHHKSNHHRSNLVVKQQLIDMIGTILEEDCDLNRALDVIANKVVKYKTPNTEPVLNIANQKFTTLPISYDGIWLRYKEMAACYWVPEEIDFSGDYNDFLTLNKNEQHFIKMILAFFAASDGIINFNLEERFIREVQITEAKYAYDFQKMMENMHSEIYSQMLDNIVKDKREKDRLFNAIKTVSAVKKMAEWQFKWIESPTTFAERLVAFACVETIFFSGMFAAIFWIKKYKSKNAHKSRPFMNGLTSSNQFIARDEGLHGKLATDIFKVLLTRPTLDRVNEIVKECVNIAQNFMLESIPIRLIGMNGTEMCNYIEYIADVLLGLLGYGKLYRKVNPFDFMKTIGLDDKTNFFERRPHEYSKSHTFTSNSSVNTGAIEVDLEQF